MPILDRLQGPADLRGLSEDELAQLAAEIRETIIRTVAATGGHLGSSLGVVELTLALHRLLESPRDRIVWDTGHQAYAHKLLTGRLERFDTLRQIDGVGGFPRRTESPHDVFDGGHAGHRPVDRRGPRDGARPAPLARADRGRRRRRGADDAASRSRRSTTSAIARRQLLIVLNDNEMSISPTVGAFSKYLSEIKLSPAWQQSKTAYDRVPSAFPSSAPRSSSCRAASASRWSRSPSRASCSRTSGSPTSASCPATTCALLEETFRRALELNGPGDRPRPHPEGAGLPARRRRTRSGSTGRRCRR